MWPTSFALLWWDPTVEKPLLGLVTKNVA